MTFHQTLKCIHCGKKLDPAKAVWLTLDTERNVYTSGEVPEAHSQGSFEFGAACAKKVDGKSTESWTAKF